MSKELIFSATKKDFKVQFYKASGPGGQHRNKTSTACRITHIDTGLTAYCSTHKSQTQNKREAFRKLCDLLVAHVTKEDSKDPERYAAGAEVVRSYHEPNDRVTDHQTGRTYSYKHTIGKGDIGTLIEDRLRNIDE